MVEFIQVPERFESPEDIVNWMIDNYPQWVREQKIGKNLDPNYPAVLRNEYRAVVYIILKLGTRLPRESLERGFALENQRRIAEFIADILKDN